MNRTVIMILILSTAILLGMSSCTGYRREIVAARERVSGAPIVKWAEGTIEYETGGKRVPVLVIHGAGGGFDQGRLLAETALQDEFSWIAPSRFGHLGSDVPNDADIHLQAQAYEELLNALGIGKVAVLAISAGGPSAIQFALEQPDRCVALVLLSAVSLTVPEYDKTANFFKVIYKTDFGFYLVSRLFRKKLLSQFGVTKQVLETMTEEQRILVDALLDTMLPAVSRMPGIEYDSWQGVSPSQWPLEMIDVPTLVIHARDDTLIPFSHGENSASRIPQAQLVAFPTGGHLIFIFERKKVAQHISSFVCEAFAERRSK
jgi:pimeloyl-ACP methyl ester carboxylesterase